MKSSKVSIKTRSTPASLSFKGQATKHTTVKWSRSFFSNEVQASSSRCHKVSYAIHLHDCKLKNVNYHCLVGVVVRVFLVNEKLS